MDYKNFTNNLAEYSENKRRLAEAEKELDVILYDLCGVRGVSYDSIMVRGNPSQKALNWLKKEDKYNAKEKEIAYYRNAIETVDDAKKRIPKRLWIMLVEKFVKNETYRVVGARHGYSANGFWTYLKRETERYL